MSESCLLGPEFQFGVDDRFAIQTGEHYTCQDMALTDH